MTLEQLQAEMIYAMRQGDKEVKNVLSTLIAQIKKAAIDKGCRDNIDEALVNTEILKSKKQTQESIDGAIAAKREDLVEEYKKQYEIICGYAPSLIDDAERIMNIIAANYMGDISKKDLMKWLNTNYRGKMDMKVAAQAVDSYIKKVEEEAYNV